MDISRIMKTGHYKFNTDPKSLIIATMIIAVLISLGFWQVARRNEKLAIEQQIINKNSGEVVQLNEINSTDPRDLEYRKVQANGHFVQQGIVYIDNIPHQGRYGFNVYAPFKLKGKEVYLLVNLGWIANKNGRNFLPDFRMDEKEKTITGSIRLPPKRPFVASSTEQLKLKEKNLWLYMDLKKYANEAPFDIYPFVIYLDPEKGAEFIREWPVFNPKTAMHTGYAIMWFSLAFIALIIFIYTSSRKCGEGTE